ncbi:MAG: potassium-transporting ATPase subunit KdpB, partial [Rhizobacter sp.]|nr:potassium-transporting ATPase subunit KdpB [Chlorobiales bacterium]
MTTARKAARSKGLFDGDLVGVALKESFVKLSPALMIKNPVMFTVEVGTLAMIIVTIVIAATGDRTQGSVLYNAIITVILFITLLFANFAEALAEARGKAQAESLRKTREDTPANVVMPNGQTKQVQSSQLKKGDVFLVVAGELIPTDGEIIEGLASIDESAITGESAPVIREAGGDKSSVTGGTKVLSDQIKVEVTAAAGESFLDKMIALVEGASRQKTPNEIALTILLAGFTMMFIIVTVALEPFGRYAATPITIASLIALFVCLIPTTIGGLLSAIGIAGMDRALRANVITKSGKAVETAGDIDTLLLDKTGTITIGNRKATAFYPVAGKSEQEFIRLCAMSSIADETPEGKSIIELAEKSGVKVAPELKSTATFIKFSAQTRLSGIDTAGVQVRKGAFDSIKKLVEAAGNQVPAEMQPQVNKIGANGGTPLAVSENGKAVGVIELQDIVKTGIRERFDR